MEISYLDFQNPDYFHQAILFFVIVHSILNILVHLQYSDKRDG